ncbi:hypothetical protein HZH68_014623 [Vespula germanica]|uniref:Uncharacterized protein n=1 Tax=Vespula germanica TaxID=30212 RepID=A0A834JDZ3_VESGE|nr:hypothetical protein HZH68_014623 [Vespula germanica]
MAVAGTGAVGDTASIGLRLIIGLIKLKMSDKGWCGSSRVTEGSDRGCKMMVVMVVSLTNDLNVWFRSAVCNLENGIKTSFRC